jgi:hypothetical protein
MKELPNPTMPLALIDMPRGSLHRHDSETQKNNLPSQTPSTRHSLSVEWEAPR